MSQRAILAPRKKREEGKGGPYANGLRHVQGLYTPASLHAIRPRLPLWAAVRCGGGGGRLLVATVVVVFPPSPSSSPAGAANRAFLCHFREKWHFQPWGIFLC